MDGNRRIIERLRKLYQMYGKPELVDDYVSRGGHEYRPDLRIAVFKWINKHLRNGTEPVRDADFKPIAGKDLRVFPEDKDVPPDALNGRIDELFVAPAQLKLPEAGDFAGWKKRLVKKLRDDCFRRFPDRIAEPEARKPASAEAPGTHLLLTSEPGITVDLIYAADKKEDPNISTLLVLNAEEPLDPQIPEWAKPFAGDKRVYLLQPRGGGRQAWTQKSPPNYVKRAHVLFGQTVEQGRVWDIAAAVRYRPPETAAGERKHWRVMGRGRAGILAAYAALLEPDIAEIIVIDPPVSHREGPIFLNVLRILDIPEALGLLAPKKLTLSNAGNDAFDRTVQIYRLAGAADKLQRQ
jgi:hypothetical protein